jgi:hypothetical protein
MSSEAIVDGTCCIQCGYDLRSLSPTGVCPECGKSVAVSLLAWKRGGLADPKRVAKLLKGALVTWCALGGWIVTTVLGLGLFDWRITPSSEWVRPISALGVLGLLGWGTWLLTIPDPRHKASVGSSRRWARVFFCLAGATGLVELGFLWLFDLVPLFRYQGTPPSAIAYLCFGMNITRLIVIPPLAVWLALRLGGEFRLSAIPSRDAIITGLLVVVAAGLRLVIEMYIGRYWGLIACLLIGTLFLFWSFRQMAAQAGESQMLLFGLWCGTFWPLGVLLSALTGIVASTSERASAGGSARVASVVALAAVVLTLATLAMGVMAFIGAVWMTAVLARSAQRV